MVTQTKKILAVVALIVIAGIALVETTRSEKADAAVVPGGAAGYAKERVDGVFALVAEQPPVEFNVALAQKGDRLPIRCAGPLRPNVSAECVDDAYETAGGPVMIVETRSESGSVLTRLVGMRIAGY